MTKIYLFVGFVFTALLIGCANTSTSGDPSPSTTCQAGYLYSSTYGCQPQCGTSSIWYNNQCLPINTTSATTCQAGYLSSAYGCLPQCGTNMVWYNNQCVAATTTGTTITGIGATYTNACQGVCAAGYTQVSGQCLPVATCSACYGYYAGYCYMGDYAYSVYGY